MTNLTVANDVIVVLDEIISAFKKSEYTIYDYTENLSRLTQIKCHFMLQPLKDIADATDQFIIVAKIHIIEDGLKALEKKLKIKKYCHKL
jgi:hypothetical protein